MGFKIFDFQCTKKVCQHQFEQMVKNDEKVKCPKCKGKTKKLPVGVSSYNISGDNTGSTRPNFAKRKKWQR